MSVRALSGLLLVTFVLGACGDPEAAGPPPTGGTPADDSPTSGTATAGTPTATATPADPAIAPGCAELREEADTGEPMPVSPPPPSFDHEELHRWASAQPDFAGIWMHPPGSNEFTVAFTGDVEGYRAEAHERFGEDVGVVGADYTMDELEALHAEVGRDVAEARERGGGDPYRPPPGTIVGWGITGQFGRVTLDVVGGDDAALAAVTERYGADRVCLNVHELPEPMDPEGPVGPLAKVSGWRDRDLLGEAYALVEIADDRETAERAWEENVPAGLPEREGDPTEEGVYGSLDAVDFERQAVVVWSAGQSGSCPGWLADIEVVDGRVAVEHGTAGAGACTADYNPYRMVLAVDRDRLPEAADLPYAPPDDDPTGAHVRAYE